MLYDDEDYGIESLIHSKKKKHKKHDDLLSSIRSMEDDDYVNPSGFSAESFLPSSMKKTKKKEEKEKNKDWDDSYDPDAWFNELMAVQSIKPEKSKGRNSIFDDTGITGRKKKKKNKKGKSGVELTDYRKELEPEMALFKNLLMDQNRFTESLQREYDNITSSKSSARGVSKQITDLVKNITEARSLSMQLVDKQVNSKKLIAELTLKQRKELGAGLDENANMADVGSSLMKQILSERNSLFQDGGEAGEVSDMTEDEMFSALDDIEIEDGDREEETEKYLKYENQNVTVSVVITDNDIENYEFIAMDEDGEIIDDYPLPEKTGLSINRSTNIATDTYGEKYVIIWESSNEE